MNLRLFKVFDFKPQKSLCLRGDMGYTEIVSARSFFGYVRNGRGVKV